MLHALKKTLLYTATRPPAASGGPATPHRGLILLAGVNLGAVLGVVYSWSLFVLPLEQIHGWTRSQTSLTYTFMLAAFCLGQLCGGALLPRRGARFTTLLGAALLSAGFLWASFAASLATLYCSYGLMAGFGLGIANIVPTSVCMSWFPHHRGLIGGLCHMSLPLGTLVYGSLLSGMLIARVGIEMTFRSLGCIFLLVAAACALVLRLPRTTCPASRKPQETPPPRPRRRELDTAAMLRDPRYKFIWLWSLILQSCGWLVAGHAGPYAVEMGLPPELAGIAVAAFALGNGAGKLGLGFGWDKLGGRISMLAGMTCMSVGIAGLAFFPSFAGGWAVPFFAALAAIGFGGLFSLMSALLMTFYGPLHYGMNFAVSSTPLLFAAIAGPYFGSLLRQAAGRYQVTFLVALALCAVGYAMIFLIKEPTEPDTERSDLPPAPGQRTQNL